MFNMNSINTMCSEDVLEGEDVSRQMYTSVPAGAAISFIKVHCVSPHSASLWAHCALVPVSFYDHVTHTAPKSECHVFACVCMFACFAVVCLFFFFAVDDVCVRVCF